MATRPGLVIIDGRTCRISDADVLGAGGLDCISSNVLQIGSVTATEVALGSPSIVTRVSGNLVVEGHTGLGNSSSDSISLVGRINTDVTFVAGTSRTISIAGGTGGDLTIRAGGSTAGSGGRLLLEGGGGATTGSGVVIRGSPGVAAPVVIGNDSSYTTAITVGGGGVNTTVGGHLTIQGTLYANNDVNLGSSMMNTVTINGLVATDVRFSWATDRSILIDSVSSGAGRKLTISGGGSDGGAGGNLVLAGGAGTTAGQGVLIHGSLGVAGPIQLGISSSYTSSITIGTVGVTTTINGTLTLGNPLPMTSGGTGATSRTSALYNIVYGTLINKGEILVCDGTSSTGNWWVGPSTDGYVLSSLSTNAKGVAYLDPQETFVHPVGSCLYSTTATHAPTSQYIYWAYMGRVRRSITQVSVRYRVTTAMTGVTAAQMAVFTSPDAPAFGSVNRMTVRGYVNTAVKWLSTGIMTENISVSGMDPGLHWWIAWYFNGTGALAFRAGQWDDIWSGRLQWAGPTINPPSNWPAGSYPSNSGYTSDFAPIWMAVRLT